MQSRLLVVLAILVALSILTLLIALLNMEPPGHDFEEVVAPPPAIPAPPDDGLRAKRQSGTLRGKVVNGLTDRPIPKVKVMALYPHLEPAKDGEVAKWGDLLSKYHVFTDDQGTFAIRDLPPDYWNLWIEKRGYSWTTVPRADFDATHTIKLYPACSVHGKVEYPDGSPAAGVRLEYTPQGTHSEVFSRYRLEYYYANTEEDGTFEYKDLPPGKFTVEVYPTEHLPAPWRYEPPLKPGENRDLGTHKLDGGFGMKVRVVWRGTGEGVPGIEVVVKPISDPMPRTKIGQRRRTDADGYANFRGLGGQILEDPKFLITANVDGVGPVMPDQGGMHAPGSTITIYLRKDGVIKGKVLRPNGNPLEHFHVSLEPVGHITRQLRSFAKDGEFTLYQVPEGKYVLHVQFGNYIDAHIPVVAFGGRETDVGTITLEEGAEIYGTVRRSNGAAIEGVLSVDLGRKVKNEVGQEAWEIVGRAYALKDGTYRIKGVPAGTFWLWPQSVKNPSQVTDPVRIEIGRTTGGVERDLVLHGEGFLKLKFMDEVEGRVIHVVQPVTYLIETATGKETRWFSEGTRLRGGEYEVEVELKNAAGVSQRYKAGRVKIQEGETTDPIEILLFEIRDDS